MLCLRNSKAASTQCFDGVYTLLLLSVVAQCAPQFPYTHHLECGVLLKRKKAQAC